MFAGKFAQKRKVARVGKDKTRVGSVGFEDDCSDLLPALGEDLLHTFRKIERQGDCFRGERSGNPRGIRFAMSEGA